MFSLEVVCSLKPAICFSNQKSQRTSLISFIFFPSREHIKHVFPFHLWLPLPFGFIFFSIKPRPCFCSGLFSASETWWPLGSRHVVDVFGRRGAVLYTWYPYLSEPGGGKRHTQGPSTSSGLNGSPEARYHMSQDHCLPIFNFLQLMGKSKR